VWVEVRRGEDLGVDLFELANVCAEVEKAGEGGEKGRGRAVEHLISFRSNLVQKQSRLSFTTGHLHFQEFTRKVHVPCT